MNRLAPLMSSASGEWQTPLEVLRCVRDVAIDGRITLDPCTTRDNPTGADWICVKQGPLPGDDQRVLVNGIAIDWVIPERPGLIYVNPPYGRAINDWTAKCVEAAALWPSEAEVIALLPARTDTRWWHNDCAPPKSGAVCFWAGRLRFVGAPASAPFPSALVYWGPRKYRFAEVFADRGAIWI